MPASEASLRAGCTRRRECMELAAAEEEADYVDLLECWIILDGFGFMGSWIELDLDFRLITRIGLDGSMLLVQL